MSAARVGLVGIVAAVVVLPWIVPSFTVFELTFVGAYAIAILGLGILTGTSGQISLGHGAFLALGGYTIAVAATHAGVPYVLSVPLAGVLCAIAGVGIGYVATRLEGAYLALATFALAVSVPSLIKRFKPLTGGAQGLTISTVHAPTALTALGTDRWLYYVTWLLVAALFALAWFILKGRVGRSLRALRDSEVAAAAFGIDPVFYKTLAFGWSAAYAGVGGALLAIATSYVGPDVYSFALSITLLVGAVLGGLDSLWGALIGGVVVEFLPLWAQKVSAAAPAVVQGVAVILVMIFFPGGIAGSLGLAVRRLARREPAPLHPAATE